MNKKDKKKILKKIRRDEFLEIKKLSSVKHVIHKNKKKYSRKDTKNINFNDKNEIG